MRLTDIKLLHRAKNYFRFARFGQRMPLELCFPGEFDYDIQIKIKNLVLRQLADTYIQKY